jgi:flagellar biosynthesis/type III secretory pathway chaperone
MITDADRLQAMEAEIRVARQLKELLEREQAIVRARDAVLIETTAREKHALLAEMNRLGQLLGKLDRAHPRTAELEKLLSDCRTLNEKIGATVLARMRHAHQTLAILRGQEAPALYGADGEANYASGHGRTVAKA